MNRVKQDREIQELRARLTEAEDALAAIREGRVDAIVVDGLAGPQVFSLAGAETIYRHVVETMGEAALNVSPAGPILFCNERFCEFVATPMQELLGRDLIQFVASEDHEAFRALLRRCGTERVKQRLTFCGPGGLRTPALLIGNPLMHGPELSLCLVAANLTELEDSARQIEQLRQTQSELRESRRTALTMMEDAQEARRAAERALTTMQESEERLRLALEASATGFWEWDLINDSVTLSPEWRAIHGLWEDEFDGTLAGFDRLVYADDKERVWATARRAMERRELYECEFRLLRPDGAVRWVANVGRGFYDATGQPMRMCGTIADITERKQAEEALRALEERFQTLANGSPVLLWVNDLTGCEFVNREYLAFLGLSNETEVQGYDWSRFIHPDDRASYVDAYLRALDEQTLFDEEFRFLRHDGVYRWMRSMATPRRDEEGGLLGYVGATVDVTERKQAEAALREADRRKDEFLAMLAHELRNPLAPIRNAAQVMKLISPADANLQRAREIIERQTQHLTHLVDDLLDVSRITSGKITLHRESLELSTIINRAVEASRPLIEARKHQLAVMLPDEPMWAEGDLTRLVQVLSNLLNNAAKYTDEGGHIRLSAAAEKGEAVIRIRDDGLGIPTDLLPYVFDLFTQADRSLDRSQGGLGIGLTLVRKLVEMHGGRVAAHSEGIGHGSEFIVRLPLARRRGGASEPRGQNASIRQPHRSPTPLRVLVVEDNEDSAEMLAFMLQIGGHEVRTVSDGEAALPTALEFLPQVIVCDIGLPGMNGYEVAEQLRAQPEFKSTRLIALSGYGRMEDQQRAKGAGFDYHLVKPVDPDALAALLDSLPAEGPQS